MLRNTDNVFSTINSLFFVLFCFVLSFVIMSFVVVVFCVNINMKVPLSLRLFFSLFDAVLVKKG